MDTFIGLDLGKYTDFCALSVMTRELAIGPDNGLPLRDYRGDATYFWQVRGLRRWPLRTQYTDVVSRLVVIATRPDIDPPPKVVVDMSGVGSAVFEQVRSALDSYEEIETFGISITAGEKWAPVGWRTFNVSKVQITSCLADALGCERVVICPRSDGSPMENANILERELAAFRIRTSKTGYQSVEAMNSDHDDCVIAISLPLWLGSQRFCSMAERSGPLRARERTAIDAEQVAKEAAEAKALELERIAEAKAAREREEARFRPSWAARLRTVEERQRNPYDDFWWS